MRIAQSLFFLLFTLFFSVKILAQSASLQRADSLFTRHEYELAEKLYTQQLAQKRFVPISVYYKLAFVSEQQNDYARTMYYLSLAYNRQPDQVVLNKLNEMADIYHLKGYNLDDFSFIFLFFRRYSAYFILFLLVVAVYAFGVLLYKKIKKQPILIRHKWIVVAYLVALWGLLNLPDSYQIAIINHDRTHLRAAPSSAAPVEEVIAKGNKVTIIGKNDEWLRIFWENDFLYVRAMDVWIVK